jgi:NTE family protein
MGFETTFEGDTEFRLLANYRRAHVNRLGAEWKTNVSLGDPTALQTELFQPLEPTGFWFVAPSVSFVEDRDETFVNEESELEVLDTRELLGGLDFGIQIRNYGEVRAGYFRGAYDADPRTATTFAPIDSDLGFVRLAATVDQLDSVTFPTEGSHAHFEIQAARDGLGADEDYERFELSGGHAWSWGRNTFNAWLRLGSGLGSDLPFHAEYQLGGFLNLSGFERGELQDDTVALFSLGDYWRLGKLGSFGKLYAGAFVQAGNVWDDADDPELGSLLHSGTLFFGVDTRLSPVYLGYGLAEGGRGSAYLFIGRPLAR